MGIDLERVVNDSIDEGLICSICAEVVENPLMVDNCEHTYCNGCIKEWFSHKKTCPQDQLCITERQLVSISRFMKNQLNALKVKCVFHTLGCGFVSELEFIENHQKSCLYDEINTRVTRRIENVLFESSHLERKDIPKHHFEYTVIRSSMSCIEKKKAIKLAKEALYHFGHSDFGKVAAYIKTHLEPEDNKHWHCVVGTEFDCFLTAHQSYVTIKIDKIFIIAFKTK